MSAAAHHTVCILGEPLQCEQRVVRLNDHVTHLILVWENRVSLHQLFWVPGEKKIDILVTRKMLSGCSVIIPARKISFPTNCTCVCGPVIEFLQ